MSIFSLKSRFILPALSFLLFALSANSQNYDSLYQVWKNTNLADTARVEAFKKVTWHTIPYYPDSGYIFAQELLDFAKKTNDIKSQSYAFKALGLYYYYKADYEQSIVEYEKGLDLAVQANSIRDQGKLYNNMGISYRKMGDYTKALIYYQKALEISTQLNDKIDILNTNNNLGVLFTEKEDLPNALKYYIQSLTIAEELGIDELARRGYMNIGSNYLKQKNYLLALEYFEKMLPSIEESDNIRERINLYNNLGISYKGLKQYENALEFYDKALEANSIIQDESFYANLYRNIGNIHLHIENRQKAMEYFLLSMQKYEEIGDQKGLISTYNDVGFLENELSNFQSAKKWCSSSLKLATELEYLDEIKNSCNCLSKAYSGMGQFDQAFKYLEEYHVMRDSLAKLENREEIVRIALSYDYEKARISDSLAQAKTELKYLETISAEQNTRRTFMFAGIGVLLLAAGLFGRLRLVRRNNRQLAEKNKIIEMEKMRAEESERSKEQFFSNVSHEFRTPLTLILGPLDRLIEENKEKNKIRDLEIIQRNAIRLQSMINELLDLYKLESGRIKLNARPENIVAVTNRCVQSFESLAEERGVRINFYSEFQNLEVYIDEMKIEKVVCNLLSNALKFTDEGGKVDIHIGAYKKNGENGLTTNAVKITVSDTGIGIPKDKIKHVFDRFYQVDDLDKRGFAGTGIGLALSKELVELHHGEIGVESHLGEGSSFYFTLLLGHDHLDPDEIIETATVSSGNIPKKAIPEPVKVMKPQPDESAEESKNDNNPLLLIVEDNPDMRSFIRSCFNEMEYDIIEAPDGEKGLQKAIENIPDLIISDVMMPKMNGNDMTKFIKEDERSSHIPVVLLTARANIEQKIEGIETGADAYITKPFNDKELKATVKMLIQQRQKIREQIRKSLGEKEPESEVRISAMDKKFLDKAYKVVEDNISNPGFTVEQFGKDMALSRVQLHRKLKALTDQSASRYMRTIKLKKAASYLTTSGANITETAYEFGFSNISYFDKCFNEEFGMTPTEFVAKYNEG